MINRIKAYDKTLDNFNKITFYHCPNCDKKAQVILVEGCKKISCSHCGYNKSDLNIFDIELKLWLLEETSDGTFMALNYEHLAYLKALISAKHRERNLEEIKNRSIASRLPKWILAKENRSKILKIIKRLEEK